jgi:hypothetical protein
LQSWNEVSNRLARLLLEDGRLKEFLTEGLGLAVAADGDGFRGICPVCRGTTLRVRPGDSLPLYWTCLKRCHSQYKSSILGLCRAARKGSLDDARAFIQDFLGVEPEPFSLTRAQVRQRLILPSPFLVARGFSPEVLDSLDVGHSPALRRTVVPVYDDRGEACVGYTSRSEKPSCECGFCHDQAEPCANGQLRWKMAAGFPKGKFLYRYADVVADPRDFVLLVEGPTDLVRAVEADLPSVASFGSMVTRDQANKLKSLRKEVLIAYDNDDSGRRGAADAIKLLRSLGVAVCRLAPAPEYHDLGEMPADVLREIVAERGQIPA